jgi:hypothetical protein
MGEVRRPRRHRQIHSRDAVALLLPACGEKVGIRGRFRLARNGSEALTRAFGATSPARGEVKESTSTPTAEFVLAACSCARALLRHDHDAIPKIGSLPARKGAERRKAHANHRRHADKCAVCALVCVLGAAARQCGARSPSGALLRHSPGRTHPPLAQLQFPRFLRPDLAGVTRFDLSQVYRAPRRPVVVPAERWPGAARERMANPPAGTAPAPLFRHAFRKGALDERGDAHVTEMGTNVKGHHHCSDDLAPDAAACGSPAKRSVVAIVCRGSPLILSKFFCPIPFIDLLAS